RWLKGRFLLLKILKRTKKRSRFLKKEILIVFIHLEASFFPDTFLHILISRAQGTIPSMVKILGTALDAKPEQFKVYKTGLRHVGIEIPWDNVQTLQMQKFIIKNIQNLLAMGYWIDEIVFYVNVTTTEYIGAASIDETDLNIDVGSSWWTGWEESQQNTEYIATAVTAEDVNMHQVTTTWWTGWQDQQPCESYIGAKPLVIVSYKMIAN
ncbi:hypothetical protein, partial [Lactobacillus crispatus]|uniref:hypothetical protein n=2 Tax=Lactobacillus crispatus TaxID=47770 RepID=UPI002152D87E